MFGAMDLGVTDDGERAGHEQARSPCLLILPSLFLPPLECCFGTMPRSCALIGRTLDPRTLAGRPSFAAWGELS
jgi:hypothetical protein